MTLPCMMFGGSFGEIVSTVGRDSASYQNEIHWFFIESAFIFWALEMHFSYILTNKT